MMYDDKKKKRATLIVARMAKGGAVEQEPSPKNEMGDDVDYSMGLDAAAEEMMQAIESKNPKMLKEAVKSFVDMCMSEDEQMPEDEGPEAA